MNLLVLGWLRPVFAANGRIGVRFRPSDPTASLSTRNLLSVFLSSQIGPTSPGWAVAIPLKVSSSSLSRPDRSRGHGMPRRSSQRPQRPSLKVPPSNTP